MTLQTAHKGGYGILEKTRKFDQPDYQSFYMWRRSHPPVPEPTSRFTGSKSEHPGTAGRGPTQSRYCRMPRFPPLATAVKIARLTNNAAKPSEPKPNPTSEHPSPKSYKAATCKAGQLQTILLEPFEFAPPLEPADDE